MRSIGSTLIGVFLAFAFFGILAADTYKFEGGSTLLKNQNHAIVVSQDGNSTQSFLDTDPCGNNASPAPINTSATGQTQIIGAVSGKAIHVCAFHLSTSGPTVVTIQSGTGTNCGTGTFAFSTENLVVGAIDNSPSTDAFITGANQALCINNTNAVNVGGYIRYAYQ